MYPKSILMEIFCSLIVSVFVPCGLIIVNHNSNILRKKLSSTPQINFIAGNWIRPPAFNQVGSQSGVKVILLIQWMNNAAKLNLPPKRSYVHEHMYVVCRRVAMNYKFLPGIISIQEYLPRALTYITYNRRTLKITTSSRMGLGGLPIPGFNNWTLQTLFHVSVLISPNTCKNKDKSWETFFLLWPRVIKVSTRRLILYPVVCAGTRKGRRPCSPLFLFFTDTDTTSRFAS